MNDQFSLTNLFSTTCSLNTDDDGDGDDDNITTFNSSSSAVASNIDILTQILLCLPVKSLFVFKLVSKQWFSLISKSYFVRKHAIQNCSQPIPGLFLQSSLTLGKQFLVLDESNINANHVNSRNLRVLNRIIIDDTKILQSCNGLILCRSVGTSRCIYYICNPTTGDNKILPPAPSINFDVGDRNLSLAFDPVKSPYYEVIYVQPNEPAGGIYKYQIEIYSSKTDSWRVSGEYTVNFSCPLISSAVFWNGSLHWMPSTNESQLLYFDMDQEMLKTLPIPPSQPASINIITFKYFGECKGHLYLIKVGRYNEEFDIYEMKNDYSGWSKRYHVNLDQLKSELLDADQKRFDYNVLLIEESEQDSLKLVLLIPNMYISYDLKDLSFKVISGAVPASFLTNGLALGLQVVGYQCIYTLTSV